MTARSNPLVFLVVVLAWCWAFSWATVLSVRGLLPSGWQELLSSLGGLGFVPLAFVFAFREGRWATIRDFLRRSLIVPRDLSAWLLACLPAALILVGMFAGALVFWQDEWSFAPTLTPMLALVFFAAWQEEVVWRGFVLPRLLERYGPVGASARLGLFWMLWHMPFFWLPGYSEWGPWGYLGWAPFYFIYTFFFTWLYKRSRGSVLVATVSHFAVNWVIQWMQPLAIENAGSLFAAAALGLVMVRVFRPSGQIQDDWQAIRPPLRLDD